MPWFARGSSSTAGRRSDLQPADTTTPEGTAGLLEKLTDTSDVWDVLWYGLAPWRQSICRHFSIRARVTLSPRVSGACIRTARQELRTFCATNCCPWTT